MHAGLLKGELQTLADKLQTAVDTGFEVFVFALSASPSGPLPFLPSGITNLKRVYHLFDDTDKYEEEIETLLNGLDRHSREASKQYIELMKKKLDEALDRLKEDQHATV